jgi:hypothetical protein
MFVLLRFRVLLMLQVCGDLVGPSAAAANATRLARAARAVAQRVYDAAAAALPAAAADVADWTCESRGAALARPHGNSSSAALLLSSCTYCVKGAARTCGKYKTDTDGCSSVHQPACVSRCRCRCC